MTIQGSPLGQTGGTTQWLDWAWIVTVRDEKVLQVRSFFDRHRAFAAAGLAE